MAGDTDIAEERVVEATGHGRDHWFRILDDFGLEQSHAERAKHLGTLGLPGWWCQMITVDYERARGLREVGQSCDGDFQVSVSKTVAMDPEEAYERIVTTPFLAGADWDTGARWTTDEAEVEVRRADPGKMLRWFWHTPEGRSTVEVHFVVKGDDKTTLVFRHHGLASKDDVETYRARWKQALTDIVG